MRIFICLVFGFLLMPTQGQALNLEKYGLGYGILNSGLLSESVSDGGKSSIYGSFTFHFLTAHLRWSGAQYKYGVRLGYTVIPRESADGAAKISQLLLSPQFGVPFGASRNWLWNTSLSFLHTQSKGQGGSVQLPNGNGTLTFFRPTDSVSSLLINLETGLEYTFSGNWALSGDLIFNGLLGEKRNMSLFINFTYFWGQSSSAGSFQDSGGYY